MNDKIRTYLAGIIGVIVISLIVLLGPLLANPLCHAHIENPAKCDSFLVSHNVIEFNSTTGFTVIKFKTVRDYPGAYESCNYICDDINELPLIYRLLEKRK